jgi:hypothetical protein
MEGRGPTCDGAWAALNAANAKGNPKFDALWATLSGCKRTSKRATTAASPPAAQVRRCPMRFEHIERVRRPAPAPRARVGAVSLTCSGGACVAQHALVSEVSPCATGPAQTRPTAAQVRFANNEPQISSPSHQEFPSPRRGSTQPTNTGADAGAGGFPGHGRLRTWAVHAARLQHADRQQVVPSQYNLTAPPRNNANPVGLGFCVGGAASRHGTGRSSAFSP